MYVSALASRKGGWSGIRLAFSARVTHPETWFLPPFSLLLKQRISLVRVVSSFHYRRLARVVILPNPLVVQTRDPRTFPRFAVKKKRVCVQHFISDFLFRTEFFTFHFFADQRIQHSSRSFLRDVWRLRYVYIYIYLSKIVCMRVSWCPVFSRFLRVQIKASVCKSVCV